jgi:hypothetical protein
MLKKGAVFAEIQGPKLIIVCVSLDTVSHYF